MSLELLSLGLDFAGGLFGQKKADKRHRENLRLAQGQFNQQMDHSVRRRVEDAKRAGVHPLFALGASVGTSPTLSAGGGGSRAGDPMQSALTSMARGLGVIEQNRASAKRDEAEAALLDSERKRIEQDLVARGRDTPGISEDHGSKFATSGQVLGPAEYVAPQVYKSQRPGVQSGTRPMYEEISDKKGRKYEVYSDALQADEIKQIQLIQAKAHGYFDDARTVVKKWLKSKKGKAGGLGRREYNAIRARRRAAYQTGRKPRGRGYVKQRRK